MKYGILFLLVTILSSSSCEKKNKNYYCLQGKVVRVTCASTVIQVLNDNSIGTDGWKDMFSNQSYDNVFSVSNKCKLPDTLQAGDTIWFATDTSRQNDCVVCAMFDDPPAATLMVKTVYPSPCLPD